MKDEAHHRIASVIQAMAGCLQLGNLPAVDVADLSVIFEDDGGRPVVGMGVASGENRVQEAVARALRDLSEQLRKAQDDPPTE